MPDGRKIPYWIEIGIQDDKLRKQMSQWNWEEIIGLKGFGEHFKKAAGEAGQTIERELNNTHINWDKALQSDVFKKAVGDIVKDANRQLRAKNLGADEVQKVTEFISEMGTAMKEFGTSIDTKGFARSMVAFASSIEPILGQIDKLKTVFAELFNKIDQKHNMQPIVSTTEVTNSTKQIQKFEKEILELNTLLGRVSKKEVDIKFNKNLKQQFNNLKVNIVSIEDEIKNLEDRLKNTNLTNDQKNTLSYQLANERLSLAEHYRKMERVNEEYLKQNKGKDSLFTNTITTDAKKAIDIATEYTNSVVKQLQKIKEVAHGSENAINVGIVIPSVDAIRQQLNETIKKLNKPGSLNKVIVELDTATDLSNKDLLGTKKANQDIKINEAEFQKNIKRLQELHREKKALEKEQDPNYGGVFAPTRDSRIKEIKKEMELLISAQQGLKQVQGTYGEHTIASILKAFNSIDGVVSQRTGAWREKIVKAFQLDKGEIKVPLTAEYSAEMIFNEVQNFFQANEIELHLNKEAFIQEIKQAVGEGGLSINGLGGGTVAFDEKTMAMAIATGLQAFFTGDFKAVTGEKKTVKGVQEPKKTHTYFDPSNPFNRDVAKSLGEVLKAGTQKGGGKIKDFFSMKGIDVEKAANSSAAELLDMLGQLTDRFGETIEDQFRQLMSDIGKNGTGAKVGNFLGDFRELLYANRISQTTVEDSIKKSEQAKLWDDYAKRSVLQSGLRSLIGLTGKHRDITKMKLPTVEDINEYIDVAKQYANKDGLESVDKQIEEVRLKIVEAEKAGKTKELNSLTTQLARLQARQKEMKTTFDFYSPIISTLETIKEARNIITDASNDGQKREFVDSVKKFQFDIGGFLDRLAESLNGFHWGLEIDGKNGIEEVSSSGKASHLFKNILGRDNSKVKTAHLYSGPVDKKYLDPIPDRTAIRNVDTTIPEFKLKENTDKRWEAENTAAIEASKRATESEKLVAETEKRLADGANAEASIKAQIAKLSAQRTADQEALTANRKELESLTNKREATRAKNRLTTLDAQLKAVNKEKLIADKQAERYKDTDYSARDKREKELNAEIRKLQKWKKDPELYRNDIDTLYDGVIEDARKKAEQAEIAEAQAWRDLPNRKEILNKRILSSEDWAKGARNRGDERLAQVYEKDAEDLRRVRDNLPNEMKAITEATEKAWAEYDALMDKIYGGVEGTQADYIKESQAMIEGLIQSKQTEKSNLMPNLTKEAQTNQTKANEQIAKLTAKREALISSKEYQTSQSMDTLKAENERLKSNIEDAKNQLKQLQIDKKNLTPEKTTQELLNAESRNVDDIVIEIGNLESRLQAAKEDVSNIESYVDGVIKDKNYKKPNGDIKYTNKDKKVVDKYVEASNRASYIDRLLSEDEAPRLDGFANFSEKELGLITSIRQNQETLGYVDRIQSLFTDMHGEYRDPNLIYQDIEKILNEIYLANEENQQKAEQDGATSAEKLKAQWSEKLMYQMNEFRDAYKANAPVEGAGSEDIFNDFWGDTINAIKGDLNQQIKDLQVVSNDSAKIVTALQPEVDAAHQNLKEKYINSVQKWFKQIKAKQKTISKGEAEGADMAAKNAAGLAVKEISELFPLITKAISEYKERFKEDLVLTEEDSKLLSNKTNYRSFLSKKTSDIEDKISTTKDSVLSSERATLLKTRRGELLRDIKTAVSDKKDTKELEKALKAVNDELSKYEKYSSILSKDAVSSVFFQDTEFANQYSTKLEEIISKENELDLAQTKGAPQADIKSKYEAINKAHIESEDMLRNKLQEKQKALLEDIKINNAEGKSVTELTKQLDLVNQELVQLEINHSKRAQTSISGDLYKASTMSVASYTTALKEAIIAKQTLNKLEAQGLDTTDAAKDDQRANSSIREAINNAINARVNGPANADPRTQALDYLDNTEEAYRNALAKKRDAERRKRQTEAELEALRTDDRYSTSYQYKNHYNSIKREVTDDYVHSDKYRNEREVGLQTAFTEMEKYLREALKPAAENAMKAAEYGVDVDGATQDGGVEALLEQNVQKVMYSLAQSLGKKGAKIDPKQFTEAIALGGQGGWGGLTTLFEQEFETTQEYKNITAPLDEARKVSFESKLAELDTQLQTIETERRHAVKKIMSATEKDYEPLDKIMQQKSPKFEKIEAGFKRILSDINKNSNMRDVKRQLMEVTKRYGANKYEREEISKAIEDNLLNRRYDKINTKGVMASVSQDAVREYSRSLLQSQQETYVRRKANDITRRQDGLTEKYNTGKWRADKDTELSFKNQIDTAMAQYVKDKLNPEKNKNLAEVFTGDFAKELGLSTDIMNTFKTLMEEFVFNIVGKYSQSLQVKDGLLPGVDLSEGNKNRFVTDNAGNINIQKTIEKRLEAQRNIAEEDLKKAKKEIADAEGKRKDAMEKGGLSRADAVDAETKKELAEFTAKITAEKVRQKELTAEINRLEKEGASTEELGAIKGQLDQTNANISKFEKFANNRDLLIEMNRKAAEDEKKLHTYTLDEQKLFYEAKRAKAEERLGSDDERVRKKAEKDISRFDDILGRIVAKIEANAAKEREKNDPMNILASRFASAISKSLGGNNGLNVDATGLATEATLSQIYEILVGIVQAMGGKVIRDPEKDAMLKELRALEAKKNSSVGNNQNNGGKIKSKNAPKSKYTDDFDFVKALNQQADEVKKYNKGTKEYILEQAKLYKLLWDYKASSLELSKLANKDLYNRAEIKSLGFDPKLSSTKKRTTEYKNLGGTEDIEALAQEFVNKFKIKIAENIDKTNTTSTTNVSKNKKPSEPDFIIKAREYNNEIKKSTDPINEVRKAIVALGRETKGTEGYLLAQLKIQKALNNYLYQSKTAQIEGLEWKTHKSGKHKGEKYHDNDSLMAHLLKQEGISEKGLNLRMNEKNAKKVAEAGFAESQKRIENERAATLETQKQLASTKAETAEEQKQVEIARAQTVHTMDQHYNNYQRGNTNGFLAVHNMRTSELTRALNIGGLVKPSTAVVKAQDGHTGFGEISALLKSSAIDPSTDKGNKLYGADAWTPTLVPLKKDAKFDTKETNSMVKYLNEMVGLTDVLNLNAKQFKDQMRSVDGSIYTAFAHNTGIQTAYAKEKGLIKDIPLDNNGKADMTSLQAILESKLNQDSEWRSYKEWLNAISDRVIKSYNPATAQDYLKHMNQQPAMGKSFRLSANGSLVVPTVEYKTFDQMYQNSGRLDRNANVEINKVAQSFIDLAKKISTQQNKPLQDVVDTINKAFAYRYDNKGIVDTFNKSGIGIAGDQASQIANLYRKTLELPTPYFEAKPGGVVDFDSIAQWILPDNIDQTIKDAFNQKGFKYSEYKAGNHDSWRQAQQNAINAMFSSNKASESVVNTPYLEQVKNIMSGITAETKGTENSLSGVTEKINKLANTAGGIKAFDEFKQSLLQLQSGNGSIEDTTQKAQRLVEVFAGYKRNRIGDLNNWFGKDVQADATSLLGIVKQIFEITNNEHNVRKATKAAATTQVTKARAEQKAIESSYTTEDARRERELKQKLGGYTGPQVDFSETDIGLAQEKTLKAILNSVTKIQTEGIKKGGSSAKNKKTTSADEAELIKRRALSNHEAILGLGATDSSKIVAYNDLVTQLDAAIKEVQAKTKAKQGTGEAMKNVKTLAQRISAMSFNIMKEASIWDYTVKEADKVGTIDPSAQQSVREQMEALAQKNLNGKQYKFLDFDGTKLSYQLIDVKGNVEKLTMEWSELNNQVAITSDKSVAKLEPLSGRLGRANEKFENASQMGYLDKSGKEFTEYDSKLKILNDEMSKIAEKEIITDEDYARIEQLKNDALRASDEVTKKIAQNKKLYTGTSEMNAAKKQFNRLDDSGILDQVDLKMVEEYKAKYADIDRIHNQWKSKDNGKGLLSEEAQKQLRKASLEAQNIGKELEKAVGHSQKLGQAVANSGMYNGQKIGNISPVIDGIDIYDQMVTKLKELGAEHIKVDRIRQTATGTVRHSNRTVSDLTVEYDKLTGSLARYQKQERESLTGLPAFLNGFKKKFTSIMQYMTMSFSIYRLVAQVRRGVQYVKEIDLALTELRKVTNETKETYDKFLEEAAKTGAKLGATISAVTEATATFAKLGYSMEMASKMAKSAIVYKNVGDNIESTEDAANSIISTMKGFRMEASESMAIVDRFNEVGNRFAITSQGIGEALKRSASALSEGGNSLDESIGLITAANEVVNDPSNVGTALKTLTLRLRGSKTELEEMGEDISDMATTTSSLQAKLLALTGGKVDIMLDETTFKNSTQILREMAAAWEDMDDISRASALELMGGRLLPLCIEICA